MADPNFEKQVKQKMEELTFRPSDTVWEKVDAEINKERKRRIPLFWLFFFSGLTVAGGIYFLSLNKKDKSIISSTSIKKSQFEEIKKEEIQKPVVNTDTTGEQSIFKKENLINTSSAEKNTENKIRVIPAKVSRHVNNNIETSFAKPDKKNNIKKQKPFNPRENKNLRGESDEKNNKVADNNKNPYSETVKKNNEATDHNENADTKNNSLSVEKIDSAGITKQQNEKNDSVKNTKPVAAIEEKPGAKDSVSNNAIVKNNKKIKTNSNWKFGVSASAGLSDVKRSLFKSAYVLNPGPYPASVNNSGTTPGNTYTSSAISPGFSFSAGVLVKKLFSQRVSFSAGLNYHYYSTIIKIGSYSNNASYVYASNLTSIPVSSYYNSGSNTIYINHFHFLELPLLMNFQLNKNKKLPIYWEAGLSVSYLINTDALHFDEVTGVYYKKNDLFNKMQTSAATALIIGFPVHGNILEIGPQINYGFTRLLNKNTGNKEHLFFAGLKFSRTFGKK
jgi:outer membrane protein with beta-barrel domain